LIDKNFYSLFSKIRSHGKLWKNKFAYEFVSDYDRQIGTFKKEEDLNNFLNSFRDYPLPRNREDMYGYFVEGMKKQNRMRSVLKVILFELNKIQKS
jgi:hypothetical protein